MGFMEDEPGYDLDGRLANEEKVGNILEELDFSKNVPANPRYKVVLIKGYRFNLPGWAVVQVLDKDIARGMWWVLIERMQIDYEVGF